MNAGRMDSAPVGYRLYDISVPSKGMNQSNSPQLFRFV